jgi:hypothetical protein
MVEDHSRSLKWQRYEVKYLISERRAAEVSRYCLDYLPPDRHSAGRPNNEYPVLSVYLDSPSRELLQYTLNKQMERFKLRARTYREYNKPANGLPAFFEIKRRADGVVQKTRARVERAVADSLLWEGCAPSDEWGDCDTATRMNLNEFLGLRSRIGARPILGTYYVREAYEGISAERIRITLDRNLHYGLLSPPGSRQQDMWWQVDAGGVVLEIKFNNAYPFWVADMLRRLEIVRRGVCKYVICSRAAGVSMARDARQGGL